MAHFISHIFYFQSGDEDVSQFDTKFTKQTPVDSPDDSVLSESANQVFKVGNTQHRTLYNCGFMITEPPHDKTN